MLKKLIGNKSLFAYSSKFFGKKQAKLSFIDKIKEKLDENIEKIVTSPDYSKLKNENEELMMMRAVEIKEIDHDEFSNVEGLKVYVHEEDKSLLNKQTFDKLNRNFDLNIPENYVKLKADYQQVNYEDDIQPRVDYLRKNGFDDFLIRVMLKKE